MLAVGGVEIHAIKVINRIKNIKVFPKASDGQRYPCPALVVYDEDLGREQDSDSEKGQ